MTIPTRATFPMFRRRVVVRRLSRVPWRIGWSADACRRGGRSVPRALVDVRQRLVGGGTRGIGREAGVARLLKGGPVRGVAVVLLPHGRRRVRVLLQRRLDVGIDSWLSPQMILVLRRRALHRRARIHCMMFFARVPHIFNSKRSGGSETRAWRGVRREIGVGRAEVADGSVLEMGIGICVVTSRRWLHARTWLW